MLDKAGWIVMEYHCFSFFYIYIRIHYETDKRHCLTVLRTFNTYSLHFLKKYEEYEEFSYFIFRPNSNKKATGAIMQHAYK